MVFSLDFVPQSRAVSEFCTLSYRILQCAALENSGIRNSRFICNTYSIAAVIDSTRTGLLFLAFDIPRVPI